MLYRTWDHRVRLQTALPDGCLIVGSFNMQEETVSTWWKLAGLDLSPFGTEELVAQLVHLYRAAVCSVHVTCKLLNSLEQLLTDIP